MKEKKVLIVGAGLAGLAAGCYAQLNGYQSTIFELHNLPGGLCTAWERKGFIFDGCIHYLFGSGENMPFYSMWSELGALPGRGVVNHREYQRVTDGEKTLIVYTDPDQLEEHMVSLSRKDTKLIHSFTQGVREFTRFDLSVLYQTPRNLLDGPGWAEFGLKMSSFIGPMARWSLLSCREFAQRFSDPFLQRAVAQMFSWEEAPVMMGMMLLAYMHAGNAGFPIGGSLEFARRVEQRYLELGGEIAYNSQVEKILVENHQAVGVRLYTDEIHTGDIVISAADGRNTIFSMLDGEFTNRGIQRMYNGSLPTHQMLQVSLGIGRDLSANPHWVTYLLKDPLLLAGEERYELGVKHYSFDPSLAPPGKSVVELIIRTNYEYWQRIYGRKLYDTEQRQVTNQILDCLDTWQPELRAEVEQMDEATPLSYERYTGNWRGATTGWLLTKETMPMMIQGVPKTLPGLKNFYMAGQWVEPGGTVTLAAASGRNAIQMICHADGKTFTPAWE